MHTLKSLRASIQWSRYTAGIILEGLPEGATRELVETIIRDLDRAIERLSAEIVTLARHGESA